MKNTLCSIQLLWLLLIFACLTIFSACGRNQRGVTTGATPNQESNSQQSVMDDAESENITDSDDTASLDNPSGDSPDNLEPLLSNILDTNLLLVDGLEPSCDQSGRATISCTHSSSTASIDVASSRSDFARWQLSWTQVDGGLLNGSETLHMRLQSQGDLKPHIYLNDGTGRRITVPIRLSDLEDEWQELHIPLAEIQDDDDRPLEFANISGMELVFEWSDMAGQLTIEALQFKSRWVEPLGLEEASRALADFLTLPGNFAAIPVADGFDAITQINYIDANNALISQQTGRVWHLFDADNDHIWDQRTLYFSGLTEIVGLLHDPSDNAVWVGGRGQLYRLVDSDENGVADQRELRVDGLPWGRHQNNGLAWNPDPDPFTGEPGGSWIYFGLGSTEDLEIGGELNATVLRFPKDGMGQDDLEIVSAGNRNAYDVVWGQVAVDDGNWHLFASENGPDFNDAPDEVNHILWRYHYGFPEKFGVSFDEPQSEIDGRVYSGSLYDVTPHASASGLAFVSNPEWPEAYQGLYVSLFGQVFDEAIVGHTVEKVALTPVETSARLTFRGEPSTFIEGLVRPLPMTTDPEGNLVVGDYATGVIYRVVYTP